MKVIVAGGGLGGLALGSGLRRAGFEVTVVERDTDLAATGGYHITLHRPVQAALERLLPPAIHEQVLASAADGRRRGPDVLWDPRGREIGSVPLKGEDRGIDIDRITLRLLLAEAVGPDLITGRSVVDHHGDPDGVTVRTDDGVETTADVLIGAEGVHSRIAQTLAGGPTNHPTGVVGVSARTRIADLDEGVRRHLGERSSLAIGPGATALYLGHLDPVGHAVLDAPELRRAVTTEPTFIWGAMLSAVDADRLLPRGGGTDLARSVTDLLTDRGWAPVLTDVVAASDPTSAGVFRFHAAPSAAAEQAPWPAGRVTAIGDAVHATPPTAGMGAGAALRDADELSRALAAVAAGDRLLLPAIHEVQESVRHRGSEVVAASLPVIRQILLTGGPVGGLVTRLVLPVLATGHRLRQRRTTR